MKSEKMNVGIVDVSDAALNIRAWNLEQVGMKAVKFLSRGTQKDSGLVQRIKQAKVDVVVASVKQQDIHNGGLQLAEILQNQENIPVIIYSSREKDRPKVQAEGFIFVSSAPESISLIHAIQQLALNRGNM